MAKVVETSTPLDWMTMQWRSVLNVAIIGVVVGLLNYALFVFFERLVFQPLLCSGSSALVGCGASADFANVLAIIIAAVVGLVFLVRERVFRPLLVVLAVALALGGLVSIATVLPWFVAALVVVVANSLAYVLFAWLAQPTNLIVAITSTIVTVALARLVLAI